ncbi:hypothetical protein [Pseudomonas migulae]|uniref:Secreted protein n=1 Tax=Pseudomonas migulae TaxID=78543 RepID=A0A1H5K1K6_9PSED|nr:hypothetical protein [Pseudomonas migulae]SEE58719.1 hypothetical protein SAMN04490194_2945 [Pseudomonas migulae]
MHIALRAAGYSLMSMFVSCGVGAQDVSVTESSFTAMREEVRGITGGACCTRTVDQERAKFRTVGS